MGSFEPLVEILTFERPEGPPNSKESDNYGEKEIQKEFRRRLWKSALP